MLGKIVFIDGFEFEYVSYNGRHYLFGNEETARGIVVVQESYNSAVEQARTTLETIKNTKRMIA